MAVKIYTKGESTKLSNNFSVAEFSCHGNGCCSTTKIDDKLVEYLQKIRDHFGKPVTISSGHRCEKHNRSVGGATASRHVKGQAADIVVKGVEPAEVAKYAESMGVLGIGLYETARDGYFVHIDTRTTKSFWYGQAQAYRSTFGGASVKPATTPTASSDYTLKQFVQDVQRACGAGIDGIAGPKTLASTVTVSKSKNRRHAVVEAIQKRLKALGYTEVGKADGVAGNKFDEALKAFQRDHDCLDDGEATKAKRTWQALLGMV